MTAFEKIRMAFLAMGMLFLSQFSYSQSYPFDTIMNRINADIHLTDGANATLDGRVLSAKTSMINNDSAWADANYTTGDERHLGRVLDFARAYTRPSSAYFNDAGIYSRMVNALWYWYRRNPVNANWFFNEISFPQQIGRILILMRYAVPKLPSDLESNLITRMTRGNPYAQTGANKTDIALHFLYRSCLVERTSLLDSAANQSFEPIKLNNGGEDLQYDNSYFQHGPQLGIASYGSVFIQNAYTVATYLRGTAYALPANKLSLLSNFNIHTFNNTIRGRYFDFNVQGRGISRPNALLSGSNYNKQKLVDPANNAYWDAASARIAQQQPASYMVTPLHTHYWRGDYDINQRPGYLFNVRTVSTRTFRTERGNNENILGKFLPDGSTTIMRTGAEYYNIFPIWEWDKVPGVTSRNFTTDQPITVDWGQAGSTVFVGGVSDSLYGATVYDQNYNGVAAKKSWFFFDNEVVCLGAGINSTQTENVTTAVNQSWLKGDVYTSADGTINTLSANATTTLASPQWVLHDSIGYFFPAGGNLFVSNQQQSGSWYQINQSQSTATVTGDVFKIWFDHGAQPSGGKYAYIVAPGIANTGEMQQYNVSNFKIVANSYSVQAVKNLQQHMMQIVFYKAGSLTEDSVTVSVDKPCVLMLQQLKANQVIVHIADPSQTQAEIVVSLISPWINGKKMMLAQLPSSPYAGSSVKIVFDNNSPGSVLVVPRVPDNVIAIADAYVRDGATFGNTNFGTVNSLPVKRDGVGFSREAYFKFDVHGVNLLPETAKLRLYCTGGNTSAGTTQWQLYRLENNSWTETGITWNNKPTAGTLAASRQGQTAAGFVDWDISALMNNIPPDSLLSFRLISTVLGSTTDASFTSKEGAIERRPAILFTYKKPPVAVITSPSDNATLDACSPVTITASAIDPDGTVSKLELFMNDSKIGEDTDAPYSFEWSGAQPGSYTLKVMATDNHGKTGSSASVPVTVHDIQKPSLVCPANIVLPACTATATWEVPAATDNCSGVTVMQTEGPPPGSGFANGTSTTITYTATDASGNTASCSFTVSRAEELTVQGSNSNPQLFFGYAGDQTSTIKAIATGGGVAPYSISITTDRSLKCNYVNDAGDEVWTSDGVSVNNACLANTTSHPVSTIMNANAGDALSVNLALMADAVITATVTDANGCAATYSTTIKAEDVRCFAGKNTKLTICHATGSEHHPYVTICVDSASVNEHLQHGDRLGSCDNRTSTARVTTMDMARVTILQATATTEEVFSVQALPNPFVNTLQLKVRGSSTAPVTVKAFDVQGRLIETIQTTVGTIVIGADWKAGAYLLRITQGNAIELVKVVKL